MKPALLVAAFAVVGVMLCASIQDAPEAGASDQGARVTAAARAPSFLSGVRHRKIPFGAARKREMAAYSRHHYGQSEWRLRGPKLIVLHTAEAPTFSSVFNTFASNEPLFGQLPGVCSHFVVGEHGAKVQLVSLRIRCRHVIGLNHVAIGIEHVGYGPGPVLGSARQFNSSLRLSQRLRCLFGIPVKDVIGHNESLSSRFYRERDHSQRGQTSSDFPRRVMKKYRRALAGLGPCRQP